MSLKNLATLNSSKLRGFLDSFNSVLCDCDGVVWNIHIPVSGAKESLAKLKECGKRVGFVSNNCILGADRFYKLLSSLEIGITKDDLIYPTPLIIEYLKEIEYSKKIFVFGTATIKNELKNAGFQLADEPNAISENIDGLRQVVQDNEDVGAVIVDVDLNLTYPKLIQAATYLRRPEVLFITGATDRDYPIGDNAFLLGPQYFQDILEKFTNRVPLGFGKPALNFNKYVMKKFRIQDPSRTLFIGDSLEQDMGFATKCGYQKLLVLSGKTNLEEARKCADKDMIPDFYLESLGDLNRIMQEKLNNY